MATGTVTTARGEALNLDELIQQASRPAGLKEAASTRKTPNFTQRVDNKPRLRGFVPAAGDAIAIGEKTLEESLEEAAVAEQVGVATTSDKSLAEHTQVKVRKTKTMQAVADKKAEEVAVPVEDDEVLGDIIDELNTPAKKTTKK